jgi:hypothetical protein
MKNLSFLKRRQAAGIGRLLVLVLTLGVTITAASVIPFVQFEAQSPDDNNSPFAPAVVVNPRLPVTTDDLVCSITAPSSDPDGDDITYTYQWYKDDVLQPTLTANTIDSSHTAKNQVWKCVVTATDGIDVSAAASDEVTILNTTPTTPVVDVTPDIPVTTDDLVCSINAPSSDPDGDKITYTYQWHKNDTLQDELTSSTVGFSLTAPGDVWKCVVVSGDDEDSNAGSFDEVTIASSMPIAPVVDVTPDFPVTTDDLVCSIITHDSAHDGDEMTYVYQWYKDDVLQDELTTNNVDSSYTTKDEIWKCVVTFTDGTGAGADAFDEITIHNSPPSAPVIDVTPDHPDAGDNLLCWIMVAGSDADGDEVTYMYEWYKDDGVQTELTGNTVDSAYTAEGEVWRCVVTAGDGIAATAATFDEVSVVDDTTNTPPTTPVVNVTPDLPVTADDLICSITTLSTDPDGDTVTYAYQWYKDDVLQEDLTTGTVSSDYTAKGQLWECVVTASDGIASSSGGLDEVTILNSAPSAPVADVTPDFPVSTDDLVCLITTQSTDPDEDTVTYTYQWYKDEVLQGALTTSTVDSSYTSKDQAWECVVTASDGIASSSGGLDEVPILNTSPTAPAVDVTPNSPITNDDIACDIATASTDPDGDTVTYSYQWYKDDALQGSLTTNTVDSDYTVKDQVWRCVVTASDGTDSSAGGFDSVAVYNSPPTTPVVDVTPNMPSTGDNLVCTMTTQSSDPDGDTVDYFYAWYRDDVLQGDLTTKSVPSSRTAAGETWRCVVTASDSIDSSSGGLDQVTIAVGVGGNVGNTDVFSNTSANANRRAQPCTMPENGTIESITIYHEGGSGNMILAVYEGETEPDFRIAVTPETSISTNAGWQTVDLTDAVYVQSGRRVWLAWVFEDNPGIRYESGTPGRADAGIGWSGGMPETFGSSSTSGYIYSIYASYGTDTPPTNQAPLVDAGSPRTVAFPNSANLDGTVTDDGLPSGTLMTTWSKQSGDGTVTFGDASAVDTTATFSEVGTYVLRLTADDGVLTAYDDVTINSSELTVDVIVAANDSSAEDKARADYLCDGSHDEVQIQDAVDDLGAGGGEILLCDGTYTLEDQVIIDVDDITVTGEGGAHLKRDGVADRLFYVTLCDNCTITELEMSSVNADTEVLVRFNGATNGYLTHCEIHDCYRGGGARSDRGSSTKSFNIHMTDNELYNIGYCALGTKTGCEYVYIERNVIHDGIRTHPSLLYGIATANIGEWDANNPIVEWLYIRDNLIYDWDGNKPIDVHGGNHIIVEGNSIYNNTGSSAVYLHCPVVAGNVTELYDWRVLDNEIIGTNRGIWIEAEFDIVVTDVEVSGNTIKEFASRAIWVSRSSSGGSDQELHEIKINDNNISDYIGTYSGSAGIRLACASGGVAEGFEILRNQIHGSGSQDNLDYGIAVNRVHSGVIDDNEFTGSFGSREIYVTNSSNVVVDP